MKKIAADASSVPLAGALAATAESLAAAGFEQQRQSRYSMLLEDYVEVIASLIEEQGEARTVDIARRFGVAQATATRAVGRLERHGLVRTRPYRGIFLTEAGRQLAARARERNAIVRSFLLAIGVSSETANIDAEGIEHYVSEETLAALKRVIAKLKTGA